MKLARIKFSPASCYFLLLLVTQLTIFFSALRAYAT